MSEEDYLWVARDANGDLTLFKERPHKDYREMVWAGEIDFIYLNPALFPNVKWEDEEPLAVVLQQAIFKSK